jgi:MprA protease rhombosortase-interaction domain-containing protein
VTHMILNRFGVGALTRNTQTDAFGGLLDEIGLFDIPLRPQEAALLNAFPRYDQVRLDDPDYTLALSVFDTQSGSVTTGDWTWSYATGLPGTMGDTGLSDGNPYVVLDGAGNGLAAIPEPGVCALAFAGLLAFARRHRR